LRLPFEAARAREAQVGAERLAHGVDEPLGPARVEAVLPPEVQHLDATAGPVDTRLDPANEAVAEDHREHVPAPAAPPRPHAQLADVVEAEQAAEQGAVPDERVERREERDGGRRLWRRLQQRDLVAQDEALAPQALDLDRDELAELDQLLA